MSSLAARIHQQETRTEPYREGYRDMMEHMEYGGLPNSTPSIATREEWGSSYHLYLKGWEAAARRFND